MKITKVCGLNGKTYTLDIPALTPERLAEGMQQRANGELIQEAFHFLNAGEREFLMTGTPPHVWDEMFG